MTTLTLIRRIKATPAIVFEAISTAEGLTHWWGPDDLPVIEAEADVQVGGRYRVRFGTKDGLEHECAGEFLEVAPPERLVMSWRWVSGGEPRESESVTQVEMHLRPIEAGTELTLIHAGLLDETSRRGHEGGWNGALDKFIRRFE